jgi:hypothetical protein
MGLGVVDQLAIAEAGVERRADVRGRAACCDPGAVVAELRASAKIHLEWFDIGLCHFRQLVSLVGWASISTGSVRHFRIDRIDDD